MEAIQMREKEQIKEKIIYLQSGLYDDAYSTFVQYLNQNYKGCQVCMICAVANYTACKSMMSSLEVKVYFIFSDDLATWQNMQEVYNAVDRCEIFCCIDNQSINFCKIICKHLSRQCVYFLTQIPMLDDFLPIYRYHKNNFIRYAKASPISNYVIQYKVGEEIDKEYLVRSVFSIISYFALYLEDMLNSYINKQSFSAQKQSQFHGFMDLLDRLLDEVFFMSDNFLDKYLEFLESFSQFVISNNLNLQSKENIFASIYSFLAKDTQLNFEEIKILAVQTLARVYQKFFENLENISFNYFDLQKKVSLIDSTFKDVDYEIDSFDVEDVEKTIYKIKRFRQRLLDVCTHFVNRIEKMMDKALDLYQDSGYAFSKKMNKDVLLKTIYFVPDFIKGNSFLKVIRDYGILDFIK